MKIWRYKYRLPLLRDLGLQTVRPPEVAVLGSVHRQNVGDMALSRAVQDILRSISIRSGMQLIGPGTLGLTRWPKASKAIVAGGALGREKILDTVVQRYSDAPSNVAMVGMSLWSSPEFSEETLQFLRAVSFLSCRNQRDVQRLAEKGIDAEFAYDNAFALSTEADVKDKEFRKLGVNVVPRQMQYNGRHYEPTGSEDERKFGPAYIETLRELIKQYAALGFRIVHIPFTPHDARFAKQVFSDLKVEHRAYTHDVQSVYRAVASCSKMIGTRYHAHIFALKSRTPLYSFSYAPKCVHLWKDLGVPSEFQATREEVSYNGNGVVERFSDIAGFMLSENEIVDIGAEVKEAVLGAVKMMN